MGWRCCKSLVWVVHIYISGLLLHFRFTTHFSLAHWVLQLKRKQTSLDLIMVPRHKKKKTHLFSFSFTSVPAHTILTSCSIIFLSVKPTTLPVHHFSLCVCVWLLQWGNVQPCFFFNQWKLHPTPLEFLINTGTSFKVF